MKIKIQYKGSSFVVDIPDDVYQNVVGCMLDDVSVSSVREWDTAVNLEEMMWRMGE